MKPLLMLATVVLTTAGCATDTKVFSDGCAAVVLYQGQEYAEVGFSDRPTHRVGDADVVRCASEPDETSVEVVTFDGFSESEVVAVRQRGDVYRVFAATTVAESFIDDLNRDLLNAGEG